MGELIDIDAQVEVELTLANGMTYKTNMPLGTAAMLDSPEGSIQVRVSAAFLAALMTMRLQDA